MTVKYSGGILPLITALQWARDNDIPFLMDYAVRTLYGSRRTIAFLTEHRNVHDDISVRLTVRERDADVLRLRL